MSRAQRGYAMLALLVALVVMVILLGAALPVYSTIARREREAELIFRGEQYARAIRLYRQEYGRFPPDIETLVSGRFLRLAYRDPITGEPFESLRSGDARLAPASSVREASSGDTVVTVDPAFEGTVDPRAWQAYVLETQQSLREIARAGGLSIHLMAGQGWEPVVSGIAAVGSRSTGQSLRRYNGRDRYDEWIFSGTGR